MRPAPCASTAAGYYSRQSVRRVTAEADPKSLRVFNTHDVVLLDAQRITNCAATFISLVANKLQAQGDKIDFPKACRE